MRIVILGTSGSSYDIADIASRIGYDVLGYASDTPGALCPLSEAYKIDAYFINGIGSAKSYKSKPDIIARTSIPRERFINIISPLAFVAPSASLGIGVALFPGVVIGANAVIGDHVIILPNSVVSHDSAIGNYTCICGGVTIGGHAKIGNCCYLGQHSTIRQHIEVADKSLIGMGAVVVKNVATEKTVVGNPAKELIKSTTL